MSLNMSQVLPSSITVSYWMITMVRADLLANTILVEISGYINQPSDAASQASPVTCESFVFNITQTRAALVNSSTPLLSTLYTLIQQTPTFSGATLVSDGN